MKKKERIVFPKLTPCLQIRSPGAFFADTKKVEQDSLLFSTVVKFGAGLLRRKEQSSRK